MQHSTAWSQQVLAEFSPRFDAHYRKQQSWDMDVPAVQLLSARAPDDFSVEFVFSAPWRERPFGVRLKNEMILEYGLYMSADGLPLSETSVSDLVSDIIHLLADEPFPDEEVERTDDSGLEWRRVHTSAEGAAF
jgi:hypothetical protein